MKIKDFLKLNIGSFTFLVRDNNELVEVTKNELNENFLEQTIDSVSNNIVITKDYNELVNYYLYKGVQS